MCSKLAKRFIFSASNRTTVDRSSSPQRMRTAEKLWYSWTTNPIVPSTWSMITNHYLRTRLNNCFQRHQMNFCLREDTTGWTLACARSSAREARACTTSSLTIPPRALTTNCLTSCCRYSLIPPMLIKWSLKSPCRLQINRSHPLNAYLNYSLTMSVRALRHHKYLLLGNSRRCQERRLPCSRTPIVDGFSQQSPHLADRSSNSSEIRQQ